VAGAHAAAADDGHANPVVGPVGPAGGEGDDPSGRGRDEGSAGEGVRHGEHSVGRGGAGIKAPPATAVKQKRPPACSPSTARGRRPALSVGGAPPRRGGPSPARTGGQHTPMRVACGRSCEPTVVSARMVRPATGSRRNPP